MKCQREPVDLIVADNSVTIGRNGAEHLQSALIARRFSFSLSLRRDPIAFIFRVIHKILGFLKTNMGVTNGYKKDYKIAKNIKHKVNKNKIVITNADKGNTVVLLNYYCLLYTSRCV